MTDEPKAAMSVPHIKVVAIFEPGCTVMGEDLDRLNDRLINLLDHEFPRHSGLGMTVELTDEDEPDIGALLTSERTALQAERKSSEALAEALQNVIHLCQDMPTDLMEIPEFEAAFSALAAWREGERKHHPNCSDPTRPIGEGMCCCDRERKGVEG